MTAARGINHDQLANELLQPTRELWQLIALAFYICSLPAEHGVESHTSLR